jgi:DNA polymerase-1
MNQPAIQVEHTHTPRLILVDGSGYIFRAYHGLPPLTRPDGVVVGAVYGFTTMLLKLREQYAKDRLVVIFDAGRATFRNEIYPDYKAHRPPAPDDLIPQFAIVREATRALNIPAIELEMVEADDLIASYAVAARAEQLEVVIVSSDKDLMQLIGDGVSMVDPMKQKNIGTHEVFEKFGVTPDKVIEVQALIGDSTDNVPGVPGIGPKTAAELILQFGTLENLLANLDQIKQPKRRESLQLHAEAARLSHKLVTLKTDVPLPAPLSDFTIQPIDTAVFQNFLQAQNFNALVKRLGVPSPIGGGLGRGRYDTPSLPSGAPLLASPLKGEESHVATAYETIRDEVALARWIDRAFATGVLVIDTETTGLDAVEAELLGIALSCGAGQGCYIPLGHLIEGESTIAMASAGQSSLFDAPVVQKQKQLAPNQLPLARVLEILQPVLTDASVLKVGHNIKYDLVVLTKYAVNIAPLADTMLMSYCLGGGLHSHGLDALAMQHFGHKMIAFSEVTGTGKAQKNFADIAIDVATNYAAEDADFTYRLYEKLYPQIPLEQVATVYETIERPLIPIIAEMEAAGILVDPKILNELSQEFAVKLDVLEREVMALAGVQFSVGSPKQLGEVLFEKLQLPGGKKSSKSGAYTTDAETLESLAEQGHAIAQKVLEWRQFAKLKSTYTDALGKAISPRDGRVHTSYSMVGASTGRLSSNDPNLQNIPIRSEEGRRIRTAFIAPTGYQLISADYSQIELRLLSHMADIPVLREAFRNGIDIHAVTASQMFGVPVDAVTSELRRRAKTINFGIIYGISAHGLSARLGISRAEAATYIDSYFKQYPGIREYMDRTIAFAREYGYVTTLYGRKIHLRDINAKNPNMRQFSERAAINAPLQGTAADIIKRAMVEVSALLGTRDWGLEARNTSPQPLAPRLLLQVHDELIIEAPEAQAQEIAQQVKRAMEKVAALSIPLTVEVGVGAHWGAIH